MSERSTQCVRQTMDFNATEYRKCIHMGSDFTFQLTFKKLYPPNFGVVSKKTYTII